MRKKAILAKEYLLLLMFDCLEIACNPLLKVEHKSDWKELRRKSKAFYRMLEIMIK